MPERATVFQATQLGVETTPGVLVPANRRLLQTMVDAGPDITNELYRPAGSMAPTVQIVGKEMVRADVEGRMSFNDMAYILSSLLLQVTPTTPGGATNTRRWSFKPSNNAPDTFRTYTIEKGSSAGAERFTSAVFNALTLAFGREEASITGSLFGQALTEQITPTASPTDIVEAPINPKCVNVFLGTATNVNEVQSLSLSGTPTGGTFTVAYEGSTTANIAFNANAAAVQTALTALASIGTNNVVVTGGPLPAAVTITFQGTLAGIDASLLTLVTNALTGGTSPTAVITTTTPGGLTRLLRADRVQFAIPERYVPGFTLDCNQPSYSYIVNQGVDPTAEVQLMHDSQSAGYMSNFRNGDTLFLRLQARGNLIEAGFSQWLTITAPVKITQSERGDNDAVYSNTYSFGMVNNSTFGGWIEVVVDNNIATL